MHQTSDAAWQHGLAINLTSVFLMTRAVRPGMRARGHGRIVQMSSVTGPLVGIEGSALYAAAKAGILGMARVLALENARAGITVNCIGPGWIQTPHRPRPRSSPAAIPPPAAPAARTRSPMRRCFSPRTKPATSPASF